MSDTPENTPNDDTKAAKPVKPKKPPFDLTSFIKDFDYKSLNETQWAMVAGGIFFVGYLVYQFVLVAPMAGTQTTMNAPVTMEAYNGETEEERFKRQNKNTQLPDGKSFSEEYIKEKMTLTRQVPFGDESMEFQLLLPNNWVMSEFARFGLPGEENYSVLTNIARYFGPSVEDMRPFLWVEVELMSRYMTAEAWAYSYLVKRGITPLAFQVESDKNVQSLYVDVRGMRSYAVRTLFKVDGNRMVLVSYGVPIYEYQINKDFMGATLNSFEIVNPSDKEIEEKQTYRLLNVVQFKHYSSWQVKNVYSESTLRPSFELHNPQLYNNPNGDLLQGIILVNVWRKSPLATEEKNMAEITDRLQELRMTLIDQIGDAKELKLHDNFKTITQTRNLALVNSYVQNEEFDIIKSEESKTRQEVWITIMDNGYYRAYLTMVTPQEKLNYVIWAQNVAAYELLIKSMKVRGPPN